MLMCNMHVLFTVYTLLVIVYVYLWFIMCYLYRMLNDDRIFIPVVMWPPCVSVVLLRAMWLSPMYASLHTLKGYVVKPYVRVPS